MAPFVSGKINSTTKNCAAVIAAKRKKWCVAGKMHGSDGKEHSDDLLSSSCLDAQVGGGGRAMHGVVVGRHCIAAVVQKVEFEVNQRTEAQEFP